MAGKKRPSLVGEIGRLLVEYPEKDWRALANRLRERSLVEDVAAAIDDLLASDAKRRAKRRTQARRRPREGVIERVARDDVAKAEKLSALKSRLAGKDKRPPLAHVRSFANSLGMKEELPSRRDQAVNQILQYLSAKTTGEIDDILNAAISPRQMEGEEYDRWVKLILGEDPPSATEKQQNRV